jgi:hypothetical protein
MSYFFVGGTYECTFFPYIFLLPGNKARVGTCLLALGLAGMANEEGGEGFTPC